VVNPLVIGIALGAAVNLTGLPLPGVLWQALDMIARAALPAALFGLGGVLYQLPARGRSAADRLCLRVSLLMHPAITWTLGTQLALDQRRCARGGDGGDGAGGQRLCLCQHVRPARRVAASSVLLGTTFTLPDGFEYTGDWVEGQITGEGVARYPNGSVYEGAFLEGRPHGQGRMVFADGSTYEGEWEEGAITGTGRREFATEVVYEGEFLDGQPHGQGRMERPGGLIYEGEWVHGQREGRGTITYPDGSVYVGEMRADQRQGEGRLERPDGTVYDGEWAEGLLHGAGRLTLPGGDVREGMFEAGMLQGQGRLEWPMAASTRASSSTTGGTGGAADLGRWAHLQRQWVDDRIEGEGTLAHPDGTRYQGQFATGCRMGRGASPIPTAPATRARGSRAAWKARASPISVTGWSTRAPSWPGSRTDRAG
jgi:hypothetical protein